jgi:hypothetical protein
MDSDIQLKSEQRRSCLCGGGVRAPCGRPVALPRLRFVKIPILEPVN